MLTITTLYPSSVHPRHGIFVETRLREMVEAIDTEVLAFRAGAAFADDVSLLAVERT